MKLVVWGAAFLLLIAPFAVDAQEARDRKAGGVLKVQQPLSPFYVPKYVAAAISLSLVAGVIGAAGGVFLSRTRSEEDIRVSEYDAFLSARTEADRAARRMSLDDAVEQRNLFLGVGYGLIGGAAALGAAAVSLVIAWLFGPSESEELP